MRIYHFIFLAFLIYIETYLFVRVADNLGVLLALVLAIGTSFVGVSLIRSQGLRTLFQIQQKMAVGENPAEDVIKSVSLLLAGLLLLIPGFFTDFLGLLLTLAPVQKAIASRLLPFIRVSTNFSSQHHQHGNSGDSRNNTSQSNVIEGEFKRKDDE